MKNIVVEIPEHEIQIIVRWKPDEFSSPDDWLGKYVAKRPEGVYVDRKYGFLLGHPKQIRFMVPHLFSIEDAVVQRGILDEEPDYEEVSDGWEVIADGPEILSRDFQSFQYDSLREHRYWIPSFYTPQDFYENPEDTIRYAKEDFWRHETFGYYWSYLICEVVFRVGGLDMGHASVCAVESDGGDSYHLEVVGKLLQEAIEEAKDNYRALSRRDVSFWASDDVSDIFMGMIKNELG